MKTANGQRQKTLTLRDLQNIDSYKKRYRDIESKEDYEDHINSLGWTDLQSHAITCEVVPKSDKRKLLKDLKMAFEKSKAAFDLASRGLGSGSVINHPVSEEKAAKVRELGEMFR